MLEDVASQIPARWSTRLGSSVALNPTQLDLQTVLLFGTFFALFRHICSAPLITPTLSAVHYPFGSPRLARQNAPSIKPSGGGLYVISYLLTLSVLTVISFFSTKL
ncbi:hypothetical protein LAD77_00570 [Klebsiella pneumoniae]|nr:hypothetical protein [Klebsiella pneumoniae]